MLALFALQHLHLHYLIVKVKSISRASTLPFPKSVFQHVVQTSSFSDMCVKTLDFLLHLGLALYLFSMEEGNGSLFFSEC